MQIDIITKNAEILKAGETQVIAFSNTATEISLDVVIKFGDLQRLYTFKAQVKNENEVKSIKARLQ